MCGVCFNMNNLLQFPPLPKPKHDRINFIKKPDRCYIDDLNDTLLELIFLKLFSSKHLSISKCVSKRWNEVISNPDFVTQFTPLNSGFTLFVKPWHDSWRVMEHPYFGTQKFCLDFLPSKTSDNIVAHHNDLVVIHGEQKVYYIANPLTQQFIVVPLPLTERGYSTIWWSCMVGLAGVVDGVSGQGVTNLHHHNLGFRIVRVVDPWKSSVTVQIYSSQKGQWITHILDFCFDSRREEGVTFKNKVHWLGSSMILVIDPFSDDIPTHRMINIPKVEGICENSRLGLCRCRLRIAKLEKKNVNYGYPWIKIWEFEDYDDDLPKLRLVVNFSSERYLIGSMSPYDRPQMIYCHPNDPDIVYFMYGSTLVCCDVVKRILKDLTGKLTWDGCLWDEYRILMTHPLIMA